MNLTSKPTFIGLYKTMLRIRMAEQKVAAIYPTDKIQSPTHLSLGQEAVSAGVCMALNPSDRIYGTYRGHGLYIAKGGDLSKFFAELYARDAGCARGKGGSMHLVAPEVGLMGCSAIVGSTIPVATGDALASNMQGRKRVVAAFFGDGAIDEGVFFESINFAVLKNLPALYVLENNGYAIHSPVAQRHKRTDLFRIGESVGLKGRRFDGNDAAEVYAETRAAVDRIRRGGPPELLEFTTYRWSDHVGPGSDLNHAYRARGEEKKARANDPIERARAALRRKGVTDADFKRWEAEITREIDAAVRFAESAPFPGPERLLEGLYADA